VSPDGRRWAVASLGNWFEVRSTDSRVRGVERVPTERAASVMSFGWSTDSRRLAVGVQEGSVSVYDVSPLRALAKFPADGSSCFIVVLPDHGRVLSVQADGRITVRSVQGTNAVQVVTSTPRVSAVAAGPTGTVVAGGLDNGEVAVLDQRTGTLERPLSLGPFPEQDTTFQPKAHRRVTALAVTPDGTAVVAGNRAGHLRMWRLSDHSVLWSTTVGPVEQLAVSPDGRFLATVESQTDPADPASRAPDWFPVKTTFRLWDLTSHALLLTSPVLHDDDGSAAKAKMLHFSPDSSMVAVPYMGDFVQVYRTSDPKKTLEITPDDMGGQRGAIALTFTPDSSTLLVRDLGGNAIRQFDARTGRSTGPDYTSPGAGFGEIAFSPDGRWLFSRTDRGLSAFDVASRRLLLDQLPLGTNGGEGSMAITSDGYLYAATETGLLRLDIDPSRWSSIACHLAGRTLTFDEWSQLLPGRPYAPACTPPTS
jgi:WD40 repeat protein